MPEPKGLAAYRFAQAAVEVRFEKTQRYWDDSGKTNIALESRLGVSCERLGTNGFEFTADLNVVGFNVATYHWDRVAVTAASPGAVAAPKHFAENASEFFRLVAFGLGVQRATRIGHRLWHYLPFPDTTAATDWLERQQIWSPAKGLKNWGDPSNEALRVRITIDDDRSVVLRVGSGAVQIPGESMPGVFVDTDFFTKRPTASNAIDLEAFIKSNLRYLEQRIGSLMNGSV